MSDSRRRQPKLVVSDEETYEDGTECCAQYTLLAINLPLILFGIAFIVLGVWTLANRTFAEALQVRYYRRSFEPILKRKSFTSCFIS